MAQTLNDLDAVRGSDYELAYASPKLFPTTFEDPAFTQDGTLGPDGRRRRALHCISDPDDPPVYPDGFINEDLRAGGPHLCKLPMVFELLRPSHPFYEHLCPLESRVIREVEEILAEWGVAYTDFHAMLQTWKFRRRYGGVPTLVISASREREEIDDSWVLCARKIQEYLVTVLPPLQDQDQDQDEDEDQHLTQPLPHVIRVEIADKSVSIGDAIHVLKPSDEIFPIWREVFQTITERINPNDIVAVGCFRLGESNDGFECPPTIAVGVKHDSERSWKDVREGIVELLDQRGLGTVGVKIHKERLWGQWEP